jgi:hypothetical protein
LTTVDLDSAIIYEKDEDIGLALDARFGGAKVLFGTSMYVNHSKKKEGAKKVVVFPLGLTHSKARHLGTFLWKPAGICHWQNVMGFVLCCRSGEEGSTIQRNFLRPLITSCANSSGPAHGFNFSMKKHTPDQVAIQGAVMRWVFMLEALEVRSFSIDGFAAGMSAVPFPDGEVGVFGDARQRSAAINPFFVASGHRPGLALGLSLESLRNEGAIPYDDSYHGALVAAFLASRASAGAKDPVFGEGCDASSDDSVEEVVASKTPVEVKERARKVLEKVRELQLAKAPDVLRVGWQMLEPDGYGLPQGPDEKEADRVLAKLRTKKGCEAVQFDDVSSSLRIAVELGKRFGVDPLVALDVVE